MPRAGLRPIHGFASLARAAIEKHVPEARAAQAAWVAGPNVAWVRWRHAGGGYSYLALRRHLDWVTGEAGLAREPLPLDRLPLGAAAEQPGASGLRVRLGELLGEEDRWWPVGAGEEEDRRQLEWIVLQIRVKAEGFFSRR